MVNRHRNPFIETPLGSLVNPCLVGQHWTFQFPYVRLPLPAQPVDATPSNQLIQQCFPSENRYAQVCSIRPSQGGVSFALHMRRTLTFYTRGSPHRIPIDRKSTRLNSSHRCI